MGTSLATIATTFSRLIPAFLAPILAVSTWADVAGPKLPVITPILSGVLTFGGEILFPVAKSVVTIFLGSIPETSVAASNASIGPLFFGALLTDFASRSYCPKLVPVGSTFPDAPRMSLVSLFSTTLS